MGDVIESDEHSIGLRGVALEGVLGLLSTRIWIWTFALKEHQLKLGGNWQSFGLASGIIRLGKATIGVFIGEGKGYHNRYGRGGA